MLEIGAIPSILLYSLILMASLYIINSSYSRRTTLNINDCPQNKISFFAILIIAMLFTFYNWYVTNLSVTMGGDRQNYYLNFYKIRESPSIGLTVMINIIRIFSNNINILFYVTTFISILLVLIAYKISDNASPSGITLLLLSQFPLFTFTGLKQSFAISFSAVFFVLLLEKNRNRFLCILLMVLAVLFHPSAYILIPLFFILPKEREKKTVVIYFLALIIGSFFLIPILLFLAKISASVLPNLSSVIYDYFGSQEIEMNGYTTVLSGIPYYIITILGFVKRNKVKIIIEKYDNYLILCCTNSVVYILSSYNVWLYRFSYLFLLPVFLFVSSIIKNVHNKMERIIWYFMIFGSIFIITIRFLFLVYYLYGGF